MGSKVFGNEYLDQWLTQRSEEILSKVTKENISTEEMLVLMLKAQTNHFHHVDQEFRGEFKSVREEFKFVHREFESVRCEIKEIRDDVQEIRGEIKEIRGEINSLREEVKGDIKEVREEFKGRFDDLKTDMKWAVGLLFTALLGIFIKLILL